MVNIHVEPPTGDAAETTAFLARAVGLDTPHIDAYRNFINGLVTNNLFSTFDVIHMYATQNAATAVLNLVSTSYTAVPQGSPAFQADRGYSGVFGSSTVYVNTTFNPSTALHLSQNSAAVGAWSNSPTNHEDGFIFGIGGADGRMSLETSVAEATNNLYARIFDTGFANSIVNNDPDGHFILNRSGASAAQVYRNAVEFAAYVEMTSAAPLNFSMPVLATSALGTIQQGWGGQCSMFHAGSQLTSGQITTFYGLTRNYMTAVGVP